MPHGDCDETTLKTAEVCHRNMLLDSTIALDGDRVEILGCHATIQIRQKRDHEMVKGQLEMATLVRLIANPAKYQR